MHDPQDLPGESIQKAIQRLKQGDMSGLETLVACYQAKAVRIAFLITQDEPAAEDVVQDTFIRITQHIRYFDQSRPFEPYLMHSVVNAALNSARQANKSIALKDDPSDVEAILSRAASPETQVEAQVEAGQLTQEILTALSELSPRQRAVIVQRYYLEMSEKEMADALHSAPGTVKWLLNAARTRLRDLLRSERSTK
jgi:RNA polymerase sigma-70 factor (ECF subfamily)